MQAVYDENMRSDSRQYTKQYIGYMEGQETTTNPIHDHYITEDMRTYHSRGDSKEGSWSSGGESGFGSMHGYSNEIEYYNNRPASLQGNHLQWKDTIDQRNPVSSRREREASAIYSNTERGQVLKGRHSNHRFANVHGYTRAAGPRRH